jgi:hypothetical protein
MPSRNSQQLQPTFLAVRGSYRPTTFPESAAAMFRMNLKHSLATVAVAAGLLAGAGSAGADAHQSEVISYNGHAGLGTSAYQHDQTDLEFLTSSAKGGPGSGGFWLGSNDALAAGVTDGTSNTIMFGAREVAPRDSRSSSEPPRTSPQTVSGGLRLDEGHGRAVLLGETAELFDRLNDIWPSVTRRARIGAMQLFACQSSDELARAATAAMRRC